MPLFKTISIPHFSCNLHHTLYESKNRPDPALRFYVNNLLGHQTQNFEIKSALVMLQKILLRLPIEFKLFISHTLIHGSSCYLPQSATDIDLRFIVNEVSLAECKCLLETCFSDKTDEKFEPKQFWTFKLHLSYDDETCSFDIVFANSSSSLNFHSNYDRFAIDIMFYLFANNFSISIFDKAQLDQSNSSSELFEPKQYIPNFNSPNFKQYLRICITQNKALPLDNLHLDLLCSSIIGDMIDPADDLPKLIASIDQYNIKLPIIRKRLKQFQITLITGGRETLSQESTEILQRIREIHCEQRLANFTHSKLTDQFHGLNSKHTETLKSVKKKIGKIEFISHQLLNLQRESAELDRIEAQLNLEHITTNKTLKLQRKNNTRKAHEPGQSTEDEELSVQGSENLAKKVFKLSQKLEIKNQELLETQHELSALEQQLKSLHLDYSKLYSELEELRQAPQLLESTILYLYKDIPTTLKSTQFKLDDLKRLNYLAQTNCKLFLEQIETVSIVNVFTHFCTMPTITLKNTYDFKPLIDTLSTFLNSKIKSIDDVIKIVSQDDIIQLISCISQYETQILNNKTFTHIKVIFQSLTELIDDYKMLFDDSMDAISSNTWPCPSENLTTVSPAVLPYIYDYHKSYITEKIQALSQLEIAILSQSNVDQSIKQQLRSIAQSFYENIPTILESNLYSSDDIELLDYLASTNVKLFRQHLETVSFYSLFAYYCLRLTRKPEKIRQSSNTIATLSSVIKAQTYSKDTFLKHISQYKLNKIKSLIERYEHTPQIKKQDTFKSVHHTIQSLEEFVPFIEESINAISSKKWPSLPKNLQNLSSAISTAIHAHHTPYITASLQSLNPTEIVLLSQSNLPNTVKKELSGILNKAYDRIQILNMIFTSVCLSFFLIMYYLATRNIILKELRKPNTDEALTALISLTLICLSLAYKSRQTFNKRKCNHLSQLKRALDG